MSQKLTFTFRKSLLKKINLFHGARLYFTFRHILSLLIKHLTTLLKFIHGFVLGLTVLRTRCVNVTLWVVLLVLSFTFYIFFTAKTQEKTSWDKDVFDILQLNSTKHCVVTVCHVLRCLCLTD